jgi:hypothetical protein
MQKAGGHGKAHINDSKKEKLFMRREKGPRHMSGDEKKDKDINKTFQGILHQIKTPGPGPPDTRIE